MCLALHAINLQHSICQVAALAQPLLASRRRPLQLEADNTHPLRCHGPKVMHCSVCYYQYLLHAECFLRRPVERCTSVLLAAVAAAGLDGGHLAINYWYHPPDNLDPSKAGFKQPYSSPYYPSIWANRRGWIQAETRAWWQQQQQHMAQRQPGLGSQKQQQQQQQVQQQGGSSSATKRCRIKWAPTVAEPGNVYEAFNTRAGRGRNRSAVLQASARCIARLNANVGCILATLQQSSP